MLASDIFGFVSGDLENVKRSLEACPQIQFDPREISLRGEYYLYEDAHGEELLLEANLDPEGR